VKEGQIYQLTSKARTRALARQLAKVAAASDLIVLEGTLGTGKTFFAQSFCTSLPNGKDLSVTSPTYTLVHEHETKPPVCHADLYRLASEREVLELDLSARRDAGWLLLVEWGTPYIDALGGDALTVRLGFTPRTLQFCAAGPRSEALLAELEGVLGAEPAR